MASDDDQHDHWHDHPHHGHRHEGGRLESEQERGPWSPADPFGGGYTDDPRFRAPWDASGARYEQPRRFVPRQRVGPRERLVDHDWKHGDEHDGPEGAHAGDWARRGGPAWEDEGPHAGRGPRSYRRSNERIAEEVNERLARHGHVDATDVEVHVDDGVVTLRGTVDDRAQKRLAEEIAEAAFGVDDVMNELRVRRSPRKPDEA
jgi:hypothetical protein